MAINGSVVSYESFDVTCSNRAGEADTSFLYQPAGC